MRKYSLNLTAKGTADQWLCGLGTAFGCLVIVLWWHARTSLWDDEIIAITHGNQSLRLFFIETLRNDIHPPLYFLQLKFWHDIGFTSDSAILFNSVVCAFFSLVTLFYVARKVYDTKAACYAMAIFALLPIFAYGGGNLRMYGLIPGCALLVWYANQQWFATGNHKWLACAGCIECATSYTHAIEFFFVGFIALAACLECLYHARPLATDSKIVASVRAWILAQFVVLLLITPLVGSSLLRGSESLAQSSSLLSIIMIPGALVAGWAPSSVLSLRVAGLFVFLFLAAAAMLEGRSRIRTLVIPIGALAVAIIIGMVSQPMIKVPVFAANLLPFLALGAGAGIASHNTRNWRAGTFICMMMLALAAVPLMRFQIATDEYAKLGRQIRQLAQPGDVVAVPNVNVFWGVMRYAVGDNWGQPLDVMPLQPNAQWARVFNQLGPEATALLGLRPSRDHIVSNGVTFVIGEDARRLTANAGRVWVVQANPYRVNVQLGARFVRKSIARPNSGPLALSFFTRDDEGEPIAWHPLATPIHQSSDTVTSKNVHQTKLRTLGDMK